MTARLILFVCCVVLPFSGVLTPARAQLTQTTRIELPTDPGHAEDFDVLPLAGRGLLVTIRKDDFFARSKPEIQFVRYDTNLKPRWATTLKPDDKFVPLLDYHNELYKFWLYHQPDTDNYQVIRINTDDGLAEVFAGDLLYGLVVQQFKVLGNRAYIGGTYHNRPVVMSYSFFDGTTNVLPGLYSNQTEVNSIEVDEVRQEVHVLVHSLRRKCQFRVQTFNYQNKPLRTITFDGADHSLVSGKLLTINPDELLLIGNYSNDCSPYSEGVYVTRIRHGDDQPDVIRYVEFAQLTNFFNYLKPKRQQKLRERVARRREEGKETRFRYRLLVHDPLPTAEGLLLVAEVYYPQYRNATVAPYSGLPNGVNSRITRTVENFHYTHAFVCGFDRQGNFLWDNCLPIQDLESDHLTPMVQVSQQGERLVLAYPDKGDINTEVIEGSRVLKAREHFTLKTGSEAEKVLFSSNDNLSAWYGQYFLAFGYQKIAPDRGFNGPQREVFYINKLTYPVDNLVIKN
jgi:hypothetical protein